MGADNSKDLDEQWATYLGEQDPKEEAAKAEAKRGELSRFQSLKDKNMNKARQQEASKFEPKSVGSKDKVASKAASPPPLPRPSSLADQSKQAQSNKGASSSAMGPPPIPPLGSGRSAARKTGVDQPSSSALPAGAPSKREGNNPEHVGNRVQPVGTKDKPGAKKSTKDLPSGEGPLLSLMRQGAQLGDNLDARNGDSARELAKYLASLIEFTKRLEDLGRGRIKDACILHKQATKLIREANEMRDTLRQTILLVGQVIRGEPEGEGGSQ